MCAFYIVLSMAVPHSMPPWFINLVHCRVVKNKNIISSLSHQPYPLPFLKYSMTNEALSIVRFFGNIGYLVLGIYRLCKKIIAVLFQRRTGIRRLIRYGLPVSSWQWTKAAHQAACRWQTIGENEFMAALPIVGVLFFYRLSGCRKTGGGLLSFAVCVLPFCPFINKTFQTPEKYRFFWKKFWFFRFWICA